MPELPHVAGFERYAQATAVGRRVLHTHVRDAEALEDTSPAELVQALTGRPLRAARRHGKYLGLAVDAAHRDAVHLVLHFAMTGELFAADDPQPESHHRLALELDSGRTLVFACQRRLCRARLTGSFDEFVRAKGLGPDALDEDLDGEWFVGALARKRGTVKNALMDQALLAGIGNEYADEILFQLELHPAIPLSALDTDARIELWRVLRRVLRVAAKHGGEVAALPRGWLSRGRKARRCPRCSGNLDQTGVAGRSSWFCPRCQPQKE